MPAVLTDAGLEVQTQKEILAEIQADLQDPVTGLGPLHDVTSPTSPVAVLVGVQARREAQYQSLLASLTSALYPAGAAGTMLDRQATITGIQRRAEESYSTIPAFVFGTPGTDVSNKLVRYVPNQSLWRTPGLLIIEGGGLVACFLRAEESGPIDALASDDWEIVSTTDGMDAVRSTDDAEIGELEEDNVAFRDRLAHTDSLARGTEPAIYARLLEVPGVSSVVVDNNRELIPNINGVPGKSVESLVIGGEDLDIAETLHKTYECDSGSFGNTEVVFTNTYGKVITIYFSRIDEVQKFCQVYLYATGAEKPLPDDYAARVRAAVTARAAEMLPGQDLHPAWFYGAIVASLPINSVLDVDMEFGPSSTGPWTGLAAITSRQLALLADQPIPAEAKSIQRPEGFVITPGWHLDFRINGGPIHAIALSGGTMTAQEIAAEIQLDFVNTGEDAIATGNINRLRIATTDGGAATEIMLLGTSTVGLMSELGGDFSSVATYTGADTAVVNVIVV